MVLYIITLCLLVGTYFILAINLNKFKNTKLTSIIFLSTIFILYVIDLIIIYSKVGFSDWNFKNALPFSNVSPFMFSISLIILALKDKIRRYFYTLITLLSFGMLMAPIISIINNIAINYAYHFFFLFDYIPHLVLSIFGIYVLSNNLGKEDIKDNILSGLIIVMVALVMVILNLIFDESFFGLSLNNKHNIYNTVLVSNSYLSALIYFIGLVIVLTIGYFYSKLLLRFIKKMKSKE